jgi:hypothetical protein
LATCGVSASGGRGLGFATAPGAGLTSIGGGSGATCCGGGFYYTVGSYACSDGKWKGEMTSREHFTDLGYVSMGTKSSHHWIYRKLF